VASASLVHTNIDTASCKCEANEISLAHLPTHRSAAVEQSRYLPKTNWVATPGLKFASPNMPRGIPNQTKSLRKHRTSLLWSERHNSRSGACLVSVTSQRVRCTEVATLVTMNCDNPKARLFLGPTTASTRRSRPAKVLRERQSDARSAIIYFGRRSP
jgi:hypothetical protein